MKTAVEMTVILLNASLPWHLRAEVNLLHSIQKRFNNKQIYHFKFLLKNKQTTTKNNTSFPILSTGRQTWPTNHTVWSHEPRQLTWARINHLVLLSGRKSFGNGGKRESQELKVTLLKYYSVARIMAIVTGIHFSEREWIISLLLADLKFFL